MAGAARTGGFGMRYVANSAAGDRMEWKPTFVNGRRYCARTYIDVDTLVTGTGTGIIWFQSTSSPGIRLGFTAATNLLTLRPWNDTPAGSIALSRETKYRVELMILKVASGNTMEAELRVDGVSISTWSGTASGEINAVSVGGQSLNTGGFPIDFDDVALNDDVVPTGFIAGQPGAQDTWPGYGKVFLLKPGADFARHADWLAGAGGTSSLFAAADNAPPVGLSTAGATNTSQIKNSTAGGAAEDLDLTSQTYDAAGVPSADSVRIAQTIANTAAGSTVSGMGAILSVSNPAEAAETTFDPYGGAVMATFPTGWKATRGPTLYLPTVDKSVAPVLRVGKRGASTARMDADLVGLYVESGDPVAGGGGRMWT